MEKTSQEYQEALSDYKNGLNPRCSNCTKRECQYIVSSHKDESLDGVFVHEVGIGLCNFLDDRETGFGIYQACNGECAAEIVQSCLKQRVDERAR